MSSSDYSNIIADASAFDILCKHTEALGFLEQYFWRSERDQLRELRDPAGIRLASLGPWPIPLSVRVWYNPSHDIERVCCGLCWPEPIDDPHWRGDKIDLNKLAGRLIVEQPDPALSVTVYTKEAVDELRPFLERWRKAVEQVPEGWMIPERIQGWVNGAIWPVDRLLEATDRIFFTTYSG